MRRRTRIASLMVSVALLAGLPVAATAAPAATKKPHVGQFCNPKKKAPKGFKCVKDKKGKYRLAKAAY